MLTLRLPLITLTVALPFCCEAAKVTASPDFAAWHRVFLFQRHIKYFARIFPICKDLTFIQRKGYVVLLAVFYGQFRIFI